MRARGRAKDRREGVCACARALSHVKQFDLKAELVERHSEHLRRLERAEAVGALACVHIEGLARLDAPCTATALPAVGGGDPRVHKLREAIDGVVTVLLGAARVDHEELRAGTRARARETEMKREGRSNTCTCKAGKGDDRFEMRC